MITQGEWVMIRNLVQQGLTKTEIARQLNISRKTVYNNLKKRHTPKYLRKVKVKSKIDNFKKYIEERLSKSGKLTSEKIIEEIVKQGYKGSYGTVNNFVKQIKKDYKTKAVLRFETMPGEQSQVDWAYCGKVYNTEKKQYEKVHCFLMILGYSRTKYIEFFDKANLSNFLKGHNNAFKYFGGYTKEILYDNLKSVVIKRAIKTSDSEFNKKFMDFAGYYGFKPILCRPYKPNTKGKVEKTVDYVKSNFYDGTEFCGIENINKNKIEWLEKVNNRIHQTTREVPFKRLKEENLISVENKELYDTSEIYYRQVFSDVHFSFNGNKYSVPYKYVGKEISVKKINDNRIEIFYRNEKIAEHKISKDKWKYITQEEHLKGLRELRYKLPPIFSKRIKKSNSENEVEIRDLKIYDEVVK